MNTEMEKSEPTKNKVCNAEKTYPIETVILFAKAGYGPKCPDHTFLSEFNALQINRCEYYFISPIEFRFVNLDLLTDCLQTPSRWHGIVITSTRCVDALALSFEQVSDRIVALEEWRKSNIFTVGQATRAYLNNKLQLDSIGHHSANSSELAGFILESFRRSDDGMPSRPLMFPCSNLRSDTIPDLLRGAIEMKEIICYETVTNQQLEQEMAYFSDFLNRAFHRSPTVDSEKNKLRLIITFFSPSGVENLFPYIKQGFLANPLYSECLEVKFVAFGKTTALKMSECGIDVWFVASAPSPKSLALDIKTYLSKLENIKPPHRQQLEGWLNKNMKIKMTDNRIIVGIFLCTDCHRNVILGSSLEYLKDDENEEPRMLGLAMIPGEHIVSIHVDDMDNSLPNNMQTS